MWRNGAAARTRASASTRAGASAAANPFSSVAPSASIFTPSGSRFTLEQRPLALDAPAVTGKRAVVAHDAVAGNGDRDRVRGAGVRYRTHRFRHADPLRDLRVGRGRPGRNLAQRLPHALLKGGAAHVEREIEAE